MSLRKLRIVSTKVIKEGQGQKGPWTLREVEATDENGNPITAPLKTFSNLPVGEVEVDVEMQESEKYGTSYLLKGRGGGGSRAGGGDHAALESRIARLESEVKRLSGLVDRRDPASTSTAPSAVAAAGIPDDDIPF